MKSYTDTFTEKPLSNPTVYKTKVISKNVEASFYTDGTFAVSILNSTPKSTDTSIAQSASTNYEDYTYTRTWYGLIGNKLFDITCYGDYAYDGSRAWDAGSSESYYTFGDLSFATVTGWQSGVTTYHSTSCEVYGRGTFGGGFTVGGTTYQFAEKHYEVNLICTKDGAISAQYTI